VPFPYKYDTISIRRSFAQNIDVVCCLICRYYLCLQLRRDLCRGHLYCSDSELISLSALIVQCMYIYLSVGCQEVKSWKIKFRLS